MHALTVNDISFSYSGSFQTLRNVTFEIQRSDFLSLVGPNGSGKSTLLRILDRILLPHEGAVLLEGRNLSTFSRSELARRIAFVPQDTTVQFPFTVLELVLMGRSPHSRGALFESSRDREIALDMLKLTDTEHLAHQPVTKLSGGERQRAYIARALAQQPEILLLDEPNAHLDIAHQVEVFRIIKRLNREQGLTVVSVSHDLNLAAAYSDRVGILSEGSLAAFGAPEEVLTEAIIERVFHTNVIVDQHPSSPGPRVTLMTSE